MPNYTPNEYQEQLTNIELVFNSLYDDDSDTMAADEIKIYTDTYDDYYDKLIKLNNQLFSDVDNLIRIMDSENITIDKYGDENKDLKKKYTDIKDKIQGAVGMKNDAQTLYNQEYYGNILVFLSIIGGSLLYARTRKL